MVCLTVSGANIKHLTFYTNMSYMYVYTIYFCMSCVVAKNMDQEHSVDVFPVTKLKQVVGERVNLIKLNL